MSNEAMAFQSCYHCGLEVPQQGDFSLVIQGIRRAMCCPGCAAVAATIFENGLQSFYTFRSAPSAQVVENSYSEAQENPYTDWDLEEVQSDYVSHTDQGLLSIRVYISNITCAACTWLIEQHLGKLPGIDRIAINGTTRRGEIIWAPNAISLSQILRAIKQIGYDARPLSHDSTQSSTTNESRKLLLRLGVAGLAMMQTGMVCYCAVRRILSRDAGGVANSTATHQCAVCNPGGVLFGPAIFYQRLAQFEKWVI